MVSRPIRVMHVMGHMMGGGVEATVMNYYRHIDRSQVQFDFVIDSDSTVVPREEIESLGGRIFVVPPYKRLPQYLRACEVLFREQKPDIVHSNINALSVFPLAAAKRAGIPVRIAHSHSTANPGERKKTLVKNILKPFSRVAPTNLAACSEHAARWLFGDRSVDIGKVHIIYNAIDLEKFKYDPKIRRSTRTELGLLDEQLVIGQVGRMCFQKNQIFTLDVFKKVLKVHPNSILVYVGDGETKEKIISKANALGISRSIVFLGIRQNINDLYQAFDVLIFPSTYEGLGMVSIEGQATGLPTLVSDQVPVESDLVPKLVTRLSLKCSADKWASVLLESTREFHALGRNSSMKELRNAGYDVSESSRDLVLWYEKLLSKTHS